MQKSNQITKYHDSKNQSFMHHVNLKWKVTPEK